MRPNVDTYEELMNEIDVLKLRLEQEKGNVHAARKIIKLSHAALRRVDACDDSIPLPDKDLRYANEAVLAIEKFCHFNGIDLTEAGNS
jgi:hypothetical protein